MRTATHIAVFLGGVAFCFLLISLGVFERVLGTFGARQEPALHYLVSLGFFRKAEGLQGMQQELVQSLPTYLSFLGVMLTVVTVVLAALAIGIGVVAAYTFREIRDEARKAAAAKVEEALSDEAINERINRAVIVQRQMPTVAELEEGFDPQDNGER